ncbi:MAG: DoxX family protein [Myxococcota bacterium]|jgi:uncharacterized membrane protein YphA (DoxX/SURF4 family)|nr:DoxX family protein [Myxococcota bacterium]
MPRLIKWSTITARGFLGLVFFVSGLNGFLQFMPMGDMPGPAGSFLASLAATGYFLPLLMATKMAVGLALLTGRFVPLALIVLAPITIHIAAFHLFLAPQGTVMALVLGALQLALAWAYRDSFKGVLNASAKPRVTDAAQKSSEPGIVHSAVA